MRLAEPVTAITDYFLGIELLFLSVLLFLGSSGKHYSVQLWAAAFVALGSAAFAGGVIHGCLPEFSWPGLVKIRKLILHGVVFSLALMLSAGIVSSFSGTTRFFLLSMTVVVFLWAIKWLTGRENEPLPVGDSFKTIVVLFIALSVLLAFQVVRHGPLAGNWILIGSLVSLIAAAVQQREVALCKHFNHNDLCHVLLMGAMYFLYRGGLLLRDH